MTEKITYLATRPNGFSVRTLLVHATDEQAATLAAIARTGKVGDWTVTPLAAVLGARSVAVSIGLDDRDGLEGLLDAGPDVAVRWYAAKHAPG